VTRALLDEVLRALAARRAVVLATDLASGAGVAVDPHGKGADLDPSLRAAAREAAARDQSRIVEGGAGRTFLRVFNPPVRVVVIGAVHVAQALAPMIRLAGHDVVVVDPRSAFATAERFPGVPVRCAWPEEALAQLGLDRRTALVALTHDPKIDDPALVAALRSEAFYVGALGSRRTHAARCERLRSAGLGDADVGRVHGPVGLAIGAVSPGEIAVSIVAELVGALRSSGRTRTA
jgi:xanthine dehydrogenase accessory factor